MTCCGRRACCGSAPSPARWCAAARAAGRRIPAGPRTGRAGCGSCSPRPPPRECRPPASSGDARLPWRTSTSPPRRRRRGTEAEARPARRPTVQFGVRVPRERAGAPVIGRERRAYYWRTAAIGLCCTAVAVLVRGYGSWWLPRIILLPELAADLGCFLAARRKIAAVKNADNWFAGLRQTIVADTGWRTDPPRFPVRWLIPALAVMAATAAAGALRYPGLPAHIVTGSGHRVPKSAVSVLVVAGQLYFTTVYSGLTLIVHRSRPDIDAADPAASTLRYRRFLAATTRALLTM